MEPILLGSYFRGTTKNVKRYINNRLKPYHLSEGHFEYFINIYHNQGMNQKELSEKMNQGKAGVTKAVQRLLSEELVYRKVKESDQRNFGLFITEKGESYIHLFHEISTEINTIVLKDFNEEELELLFKLNQKMYENTKKL